MLANKGMKGGKFMISVRCPVCNRRIFDISEDAVGPISYKCKCSTMIIFYEKDKIKYYK